MDEKSKRVVQAFEVWTDPSGTEWVAKQVDDGRVWWAVPEAGDGLTRPVLLADMVGWQRTMRLGGRLEVRAAEFAAAKRAKKAASHHG
jgi:hypothetical protein